MNLIDIQQHGFAVFPEVLNQIQIEKFREVAAQIEGEGISKRESVFAIRNLLDAPEIQELARSKAVRDLIEPILGEGCFAVRGIFFDKTPDANWKVVWHQDLSIAVQKKQEVEGFGPWSEKAGAVHAQPPREVLENMLAIRIHLDDCDESNGALRVVSGSHLLGKLESTSMAQQTSEFETVPVPNGGAMLMRPLLLHASSPSQSPNHRRVIHLEFAGCELPDGVEWRWKV